MLQVHASSSPVVMCFDLVVLVALTEQRPSFKLLKSRIAYIHSRQVYQFRNQLKLFTARTCRMWLSKLCKSLVKKLELYLQHTEVTLTYLHTIAEIVFSEIYFQIYW